MLPPRASPDRRGQYFVVHAPRQTGNTTVLAALARALTAEGRYVAVRFSCETAEVAGDDYGAAEEQVRYAIRRAALVLDLPDELVPPGLARRKARLRQVA